MILENKCDLEKARKVRREQGERVSYRNAVVICMSMYMSMSLSFHLLLVPAACSRIWNQVHGDKC